MKKQIKHVIIILLALLVSMEVTMTQVNNSGSRVLKGGGNPENGKKTTSPAWKKPSLPPIQGHSQGGMQDGGIKISTPRNINTPLGPITNIPTLGVNIPQWAADLPKNYYDQEMKKINNIRSNPMTAGITIPKTIGPAWGPQFSPSFAGEYDFNLNPFYDPAAYQPTNTGQRNQFDNSGQRRTFDHTGQKPITPYNGMTDPLTSGGGFGSRYGGNWGGGGGGGYGGYDGYSSLPAWYLNLVNWNIR